MSKNTVKAVGSHGNENNSEATNAAHKGCKHDANLRKRGFLRFQVGLILAMGLVYLGLEASFLIKDKYIVEVSSSEELPVEYYPDLAFIEVEKPVEKKLEVYKPVINPYDFDIIKNDDVIERGKEFISEPSPDVGELDMTSIRYIDTSKEDVPVVIFDALEEAPIFPGCEKVAKAERKACFQKQMHKHIQRNFRYPEYERTLGTEGKVFTMFKIDEHGNIIDIQMRGTSKGMEKEVARIISKLPKMVPGKQGGRSVRVPYSLPVVFKIPD
jgi:protein TonB